MLALFSRCISPLVKTVCQFPFVIIQYEQSDITRWRKKKTGLRNERPRQKNEGVKNDDKDKKRRKRNKAMQQLHLVLPAVTRRGGRKGEHEHK